MPSGIFEGDQAEAVILVDGPGALLVLPLKPFVRSDFPSGLAVAAVAELEVVVASGGHLDVPADL